MPLAGTGHRARPGNRKRLFAGALLSALLVVTLGACATGNVEEARIAETREASKEAVLPAVQATKIVKEFFPDTPTPMPTATPLPTIATLTLATQIGADNQPVNEVGSVTPGSTVYAVAQIYHLSAGETAIAVWTTNDGTEIGRTEVPIDRSIDGAWVPFQWTASVGSGTYAVYVYVGDRQLNSLVFRVG